MTEKDFNKIKKDGILTLLPFCDNKYNDSVEFMFGNIIELPKNNSSVDNKKLIDLINSKKLSQLIIINYDESYREILPYISPKVKVKWIFTPTLASLTNPGFVGVLKTIVEFYDRDLITKIGCFDDSLYKCLKKAKYNVIHILPNIKINKKKSKKTNDLAIISKDYDPNHSYYNMLSALKLVDYDVVKIKPKMDITNRFVQDFNIKFQKVEDINVLENNNAINLYVNFTNSDIFRILKSLDSGIPCLVGNVDIFDNSKYLKEQLVLKSDDDVNEIAQKINDIKENKEKILKEYYKFRQNYDLKSKKSVAEFLK